MHPKSDSADTIAAFDAPRLLESAWEAYGDHREITAIKEISAKVSTNVVYQVSLNDDREVIAKISQYGSYVHFRQDHYRIDEWTERLRNTRFGSFLAPVLRKNGQVFTYREGTAWVVFYQKTEFYDFLPKILSDAQIESFAEEMALFHRACTEISERVEPTWQTLGSDVAILYDSLSNEAWLEERGFGAHEKAFLREHCDAFLHNADQFGYHSWQKIPVLIDWNIGNFSVGMDREGFKFFSRWDYDWFRIEPRTLDFYFCARVVREEGDQTAFSYLIEPFFEPRFKHFLSVYHQVFNLSVNEVLFLKEAYRFFILNYVIRIGEHFFRPEICRRLQREAIDLYLPALELTDFSELADLVSS